MDARKLPVSGDTVLERYRLVECLGAGGFCNVWKAETLDGRDIAAVRLPVEELFDLPQCVIVFEREYGVYKKLEYSSIAKALEYGIDINLSLPVLVMEFLEGKNLLTILKEPHLLNSLSLDPYELIERIAESIVHVNNIGFVHSNIKPGKFFINDDGSIKLYDFTLARVLKTKIEHKREFGLDLNSEVMFDPDKLGALTPAYASPEMLGGEDANSSDDVWAFALIAFQILAGSHPFNKLPATDKNKKLLNVPVISGLSRRQNRAFQKALRYERDRRTTSIEQFVEELKPRKFFTW